MATTGTVRDLNMERLRGFVRGCESVSVAGAARGTGLSAPTAARLIAELVARGELRERGLTSSRGGRPAMAYALNPGYLAYLLARVEKDRLVWRLCDYAGAAVDRGEQPLEGEPLAALEALLGETRRAHPQLRAMYVGLPAFVSGGIIRKSYPLPSLQGLDLPAHFAARTGLSVGIENDANCAAIGRWARSGLRTGAIACLHFTERLAGAGLVIDGRIWRGRSGIPGEFTFGSGGLSAFAGGDLYEHCATLTTLYAVTVDPDLMVFYNRFEQPDAIERIRALCARTLPEELLPEICIMDDWAEDYMLGLDLQARGLLGIR